MRNRVVIEKTKTGYSAYSPRFPGCIATGKSIKEVKKNMKAAIKLHLGGKKQFRYRNTKLPLKYFKHLSKEHPASKHSGNPNGGSPNAGKLLMASQKYLRETGQTIDD